MHVQLSSGITSFFKIYSEPRLCMRAVKALVRLYAKLLINVEAHLGLLFTVGLCDKYQNIKHGLFLVTLIRNHYFNSLSQSAVC